MNTAHFQDDCPFLKKAMHNKTEIKISVQH